MRKIKLAPSFDQEFFEISSYVEDRFGIAAADAFEVRFRQIAANLASLPLSGTQGHGYDTDLFGFILFPNWIFTASRTRKSCSSISEMDDGKKATRLSNEARPR